MNQDDVYSKEELLHRLYRYCWDENRHLPIKLFADECGIHMTHFRNVFQHRKAPLSDTLQIRASRILRRWERGEIAVMQHRQTRRKFLQYRDIPKPRLSATLALSFQNGQLTLQAKTHNRSDYGDPEPLAHGGVTRLQMPRTRPVRKF